MVIRPWSYLFYYQNLWMKFKHNGLAVQLYGVQQPSINLITASHLKKIIHSDVVAQFFHLTIEPHRSYVDPDALQMFSSALHSLLFEYAGTSTTPSVLPPSRSLDHSIPLLPNMPSMNVKPHRYPHLLKAEIKRLVSETLAMELFHPVKAHTPLRSSS